MQVISNRDIHSKIGEVRGEIADAISLSHGVIVDAVDNHPKQGENAIGHFRVVTSGIFEYPEEKPAKAVSPMGRVNRQPR